MLHLLLGAGLGVAVARGGVAWGPVARGVAVHHLHPGTPWPRHQRAAFRKEGCRTMERQLGLGLRLRLGLGLVLELGLWSPMFTPLSRLGCRGGGGGFAGRYVGHGAVSWFALAHPLKNRREGRSQNCRRNDPEPPTSPPPRRQPLREGRIQRGLFAGQQVCGNSRA